MDSKWQPIETAPKGYYKKVKIRDEREREVHVPEYFLVPTSDGKVTISYWVPSQERFCMFTKKTPPTHWMPLPEPPTEGENE